MQPDTGWTVSDRFVELHCRWLTLIGEHLQDHQGQVLEYWRIEKANSVIVLPIQADRLLIPTPSYRPGVGLVTLDFPGGRIAAEQSVEQAAIAALQRELGIDATAINQLIPLNMAGWAVNSSFSNQRLYGMVAHIAVSTQLASNITTYPIAQDGVNQLLQTLTCLQCRAVLLEWCFKFLYGSFSIAANSPHL
jgi:hypothetical protein